MADIKYKINPFTGDFDGTLNENLYSFHDDGTSAGQLAFWDGSAWTYAETSELFWDDTNKRLGIGTDSPTEDLEVDGNIKTTAIYFN